MNRRTLSKTPRHYCSSELFFFPSEGRKALASSSTRILKNALHKSIIVETLLPVGMDVSMIWGPENKTSLSGFENCGQRRRMEEEEHSRYFMVATADVYGHVWGLLWAHPEISRRLVCRTGWCGWRPATSVTPSGRLPAFTTSWRPLSSISQSTVLACAGSATWFNRAQ